MHAFTIRSGASESNFAAGAALTSPIRLMREGPAGKNKSRAWIFDPDTAPRMRDLQLVAVPFSSFVSPIIRDEIESFNTKIFFALSGEH
jgi:hypothetical protein